MEHTQQFQHRKHGVVEILAMSSCLTRIKTSLNHEFWVPKDQLEPYESREQKAARKQQDKLRSCLTKCICPSQFLQYVIENYTSIGVAVKAGQEERFESEWVAVTGQACAEKYATEDNRWGISGYVFFPTPPSCLVTGDLNVVANPVLDGESCVFNNDFFWQVVAEVKRLGSRVRA